MSLRARSLCARLLAACLLVHGFAAPALAVDSEPAVVVQISVESRAHVDTREVRRLLQMHVGDTWNPALVPDMIGRLQATQLFSDVQIDTRPAPDGVEVVVRLDRRPIVTRIRFRGNDALGSEQLRRATRLQEGNVFTPVTRDYALERITSLYRGEGFSDVNVALQLYEGAPGDLDLVFVIAEGEPVIIRSIEFLGSPALPDETLHKALGFEVGDRFRDKLRREAEHAVETRLRKAGYYEANADAEWNVHEHAAELRLSVQSGPHVDVVFTGNEKLSDGHLLDLVNLEKRVVVTDGTWRELARRIRQEYQAAGYHEVEVNLTIDADGPQKRVIFAIAEGERFEVAPVAFAGAERVPEAVLRDAMLTGPSSWIPWRRGAFVQEDFDEDLKRLWFLYRRYGFLDAQIVDYRIRVDREERRIHMTVVIEEGPQTSVGDITLVGFDELAGKLPALQQQRGEPLNVALVEADRRRLETALQSDGYLEATVDFESQTQPTGGDETATIRFVAHAGPRARVRTIIVQNNFDTAARVVRRELPFKEGKVLSGDALLAGQSNIYRLGLFRSVAVETLPATADETLRDVAVNLSERPPISVQFGAGYNTRDGFRGFTEVAHSNLQGKGRRLSLRADAAIDPSQTTEPNEYLGDLGYREPRIFDLQWNLRTNLVAQRATRSIDQFSIERIAFIPAIERVIVPGLQVGFESQIEKARIFDVKPDVLAFNPRDEGNLDTTSVGTYFIYEGRDDAFAPTRGVFDSVRLRVAPGFLDSDIPFVKFQAHHSQYIPLSDRFTLVYAMRGGWARTIESADVVPLRERFFLGGRTTVRGFDENSVGPQGAPSFDQYGNQVFDGGNPLGGDLSINLNVELRFPLLLGASGVVFSDGGGVYFQDDPIRFDDFRRSAGLGLLYKTPVGPVALHYGFKLDRRADESIGEVHFSIGTIF